MQNNITCIIVDDEQDAIELLSDRLNYLFKNIMITGKYLKWEEALHALKEEQPDVLLLDISMPGKSGLDLLKLLPDLESEIIFVTAHEEYALDAFAFPASGYLLKPVDDVQLYNVINKVSLRIQHRKTALQKTNVPHQVTEKIGISNNHGIDYINVSDILYMESTNKCTKIVTARGEYTSSLYLGRFLYLTKQHSFFQIHRSYIINLNSIVRYETTGVVIMSNKAELPVARANRNDFLNILGDHSE